MYRTISAWNLLWSCCFFCLEGAEGLMSLAYELEELGVQAVAATTLGALPEIAISFAFAPFQEGAIQYDCLTKKFITVKKGDSAVPRIFQKKIQENVELVIDCLALAPDYIRLIQKWLEKTIKIPDEDMDNCGTYITQQIDSFCMLSLGEHIVLYVIYLKRDSSKIHLAGKRSNLSWDTSKGEALTNVSAAHLQAGENMNYIFFSGVYPTLLSETDSLGTSKRLDTKESAQEFCEALKSEREAFVKKELEIYTKNYISSPSKSISNIDSLNESEGWKQKWDQAVFGYELNRLQGSSNGVVMIKVTWPTDTAGAT